MLESQEREKARGASILRQNVIRLSRNRVIAPGHSFGRHQLSRVVLFVACGKVNLKPANSGLSAAIITFSDPFTALWEKQDARILRSF
jgi:hypothetical protein